MTKTKPIHFCWQWFVLLTVIWAVIDINRLGISRPTSRSFSCSLTFLLMEDQALHGMVSLFVKITYRVLVESVNINTLPSLLHRHCHRGWVRRWWAVSRWRCCSWFKSLRRLSRRELRTLLRDLENQTFISPLQSLPFTVTPLGIWKSVRVSNWLHTVSVYPFIFTCGEAMQVNKSCLASFLPIAFVK